MNTDIRFESYNKDFNHIVETYFQRVSNDARWLLIALTFAKEGKLKITNKYSQDDLLLVPIPNYLDNAGIAQCEYNCVITGTSEEKELFQPYIEGVLFSIIDRHNGHFFSVGQKYLKLREVVLFLAERLTNIPTEWYNENASIQFDKILARTVRNQRPYDGMFYQPKELTSLVSTIIGVMEGNVYNPFAGIASYVTNLEDNIVYQGQEISDSFFLAKLNIRINNKSNAICERGDSINEWKGDNGFDYIIATPPFNTKCNSEYGSTDMDYLIRSSYSAKRRAIGVYPEMICMSARASEKSPIRDIINQDWIESVVLLPAGIFYSVGISTVIITVNKAKSNKGYVRFVDGSKCFTVNGRISVIDVDTVLRLLQDCNEGLSCDVHISDIKNNGYILSPSFYTLNKPIEVPEGYTVHKVSEFLSPMRTSSFEKNEGFVFSFPRKGENLANDTIFAKDLKKINLDDVHMLRIVSTDCIVLRLSRFIKASYLNTEGQEVHIPQPYIPYHVDKEKIEPLYLLGEFKKSYFLNQIERFVSGYSAPKRADFMNMTILVPDNKGLQIELAMNEQERKTYEFQANLVAKTQDKFNAYVLNQRQRKHAVAQVLNEIIPALENIEDFILENDSVTKDSVVSRRFGTTLGQYVISLHKQLSKVDKMVDNFTSEEFYGQPELVNLDDFLVEYCKSKLNERYHAFFVHKYEDEEIEQEVNISRRDLTQILDNLFVNAAKYGFIDLERSDYAIRIETNAIHDDKEPVVIKVSNNGIPVSACISIPKLFTWGIGQGTGIGCWQVKDIAEHFGGSVSYHEFPDDPDGFVSEFSIVLPLAE